MRKVAAVTVAILLQNRWQLFLLAAWPWLFTFLLRYAGGAPSTDDVVSLLHQECLYGLALIAILASNAYGTELRSRRTIFVLSRAVSRNQYLAALWLSASVPGILYIVSMLGSGLIAIAPIPIDSAAFLYMLLALLFLIAWVSALGVLCSLVLPGFMAWAGVSLAASIMLYLSGDSMYLGPGWLVRRILYGLNFGNNIAGRIYVISVASTLLQISFLALLACWIFRGKDIYSLND